MSFSEWVQGMVEAGLKNFSPTVDPDEDLHDLRRQRNDLRQELEATRDRVRELETLLYEGEREAIAEFVAANPGTDSSEIIQHIMNSTPERVSRQLNVLEGDRIKRDGEEFYPMGGDE